MQHQMGEITTRKATGPGALDHWVSVCQTCGYEAASTMLVQVQEDRRAHVDYMARKDGAK